MAQPKFPVRLLLRSIVTWAGRLGKPNAPSVSVKSANTRTTTGGTVVTVQKIKSDDAIWNMFFTPYVWAGLRYRDISRLWTGAAPTKNEEGTINSPAQIQALDDDGNDAESEQLDACRWLFDRRLKNIPQLIKEITYAKLILKKSVHEILWIKETDGDYAGKIVIDGFLSVDPTLFEFNPTGYAPGLYMQEIDGFGNRTSSFSRVDERRFLVVTNQFLFNDRNGISELEPLREAEPRRADAEKSWGRGAQRHGHGHIIGYYGRDLLGNSAQTDRDNFQEMLENIGADTVSMAYEGNQIQELNVTVDADVFQKFIDEQKAQISLVLTGSTSTFLDDAGGTKARLETSETAQESQLEQLDAGEISTAISEQVLRRFCDFNWLDTEIYPKMQLITEEVIAPTTPETQPTQIETMNPEEMDGEEPEEGEEEPIEKQSKRPVVKFADIEDTPEPVAPVAIPAGYKDFPNADPLSPEVKDVLDYARDALGEMPVKDYAAVTKTDAPFVFTVKRFRGYTSDMLPILQGLKTAIDITLDADSEKDAWEEYFQLATTILRSNGIDVTPGIRDDLNISFRQARQNVFSEAMLRKALEDDAIVGLRKVLNTSTNNHHDSHVLWDGVAIPKNHPELQRGGRLRNPMDFGCICRDEYVYNLAELTPESEWPKVWPGDTYTYYAQPTAPEAQ